MYSSSFSVRNPFKVEFLDGPRNGGVGYYPTLRVARSVARRYVSKPIAGRFLFKTPCCEIFILTSFGAKLIEVVM